MMNCLNDKTLKLKMTQILLISSNTSPCMGFQELRLFIQAIYLFGNKFILFQRMFVLILKLVGMEVFEEFMKLCLSE